jgi:HEAT repeat protein
MRKKEGRIIQPDLFAWRQRDKESDETADFGAASPDARQSTLIDPQDIATMTPEALLSALGARTEAMANESQTLLLLMAEVGRRRDQATVPLLVNLCRRHAGFDRSRTLPEVVAALETLAAIGSAEGAPAILQLVPAILQLVRSGAFGSESTAAALRYFAAVRYRPAADLLDHCFTHERPENREAACTLAAAVGASGRTGTLLELCTDINAGVVDAALMALGHLGYGPVKDALEARLLTAPPGEIPKFVEALVLVSDEDTAVHLGRLAERTEDKGARCAIVRALADLESTTAATWLLRLVEDPCARVRRAVIAGLEARDDPRCHIALQHLASDADTEVAGAAKRALRALA